MRVLFVLSRTRPRDRADPVLTAAFALEPRHEGHGAPSDHVQ
jgi:hypothetical protein